MAYKGSRKRSYGAHAGAGMLNLVRSALKKRRVAPARRAAGARRSPARSTKYKSRSRTGTRTKYRSRGSRGPGEHLELSQSACTIWLRRPQQLYKPLGRFRYIQQNYGNVQAGFGQQGVKTIAGHMTISQLITSSSAPVGYNQFNTAAFALNPYQTNTGSSVLSSVVAPPEDRIHIHSTFVDLQLSNMSASAAHVELYWVTPKKGLGAEPDVEWNRVCSTYETLGQSAAGQASDASGVQTQATVGYPTYGLYGETPTAHKGWNQMYKVLRKMSIPLSSGATKKIIYKINHNKTFVKSVVTEQNVVSVIAQPFSTVYCMMIVRGVPVLDDNGGTQGNPTTSNAAIAWTTVSRYTFSTLGAARLDYNRAMPQFYALTGSSATGAKLMGELNAAVTMAVV
nr:MAG: capsid protein [Cressdnaviricota sp.]